MGKRMKGMTEKEANKWAKELRKLFPDWIVKVYFIRHEMYYVVAVQNPGYLSAIRMKGENP